MTVAVCSLSRPVGVISSVIIVSEGGLLGAPDVSHGGLLRPLGGQLAMADGGPSIVCLTCLYLGCCCRWVFESHYSTTGPLTLWSNGVLVVTGLLK